MKDKKRLFITIAAGVLIFALIITGVGISMINSASTGTGSIVDKTDTDTQVPLEPSESEEPSSEGESEEGYGEDVAGEMVMNPSVELFLEEDAKAINASILEIETMSDGIYVEIENNNQLAALEKGDLFMLDGTIESPFGGTFIGKVLDVHNNGNSTTLVVDTPTIDEAFNSISFDFEDHMKVDNIKDIQLAEGVSIELPNKNAQQPVAMLPVEESESVFDYKGATSYVTAQNSQQGHALLPEWLELEVDFEDGFLLAVNMDIGKLLEDVVKGSTTGTNSAGTTQPSASQPGTNRPGIGDILDAETTLQLSGSIGIKDVDIKVTEYEWNILDGEGLENLAVKFNADLLYKLSLTGGWEGSLHGKTTEVKYFGEGVTLEGLDEKLIPIAYVNVFTEEKKFGIKNEELRKVTSAAPLTYAFIIYTDMHGEVKISATVELVCKDYIRYENTIVKDGKWVWDAEDSIPYQPETALSASVTGEVDGDIVLLGASLNIYVFNINVFEIVAAKVGAEMNGTIGVKYDSPVIDMIKGKEQGVTPPEEETPPVDLDTNGDAPPKTFEDFEKLFDNLESEYGVEFPAEFYARFYVKAFQMHLKTNVELAMSGLKVAKEFGEHVELFDWTIAEWGDKPESVYDPSSMNYNAGTAYDDKASYYLDENGSLVRKENGYHHVIGSGSYICGIDDTYIYVVNADRYDSSVSRIAKDGSTERNIISAAKKIFCMQDNYIYYTSAKDTTVVRRIDVATLIDESFCDMPDRVTFFGPASGNFYLVENKMNEAATMLGGGQYHLYTIDGDGVLTDTKGMFYGQDDFYTLDYGTYKVLMDSVEIEMGRYQTRSTYIRPGQGGAPVKIEEGEGYMFLRLGVYAVQEADGKYNIVRYNDTNGSKVVLTQVHSYLPSYTLTEDEDGNLYYVDKVEGEYVVYRTDEDCSRVEILDKITSPHMRSVEFNDCYVYMCNGTMYLYVKDIMEDTFTNVYRFTLY